MHLCLPYFAVQALPSVCCMVLRAGFLGFVRQNVAPGIFWAFLRAGCGTGTKWTTQRDMCRERFVSDTPAKGLYGIYMDVRCGKLAQQLEHAKSDPECKTTISLEPTLPAGGSLYWGPSVADQMQHRAKAGKPERTRRESQG